MKTLNIISTFVFVCILASVSMTSVAQNQNGQTPDMQVYSVPNAMKIDYQNPPEQRIDIVVYDMTGHQLEVFTTYSPNGTIMYTAEELEAKGGTGTYDVVLYAGDDHKKIKKSTIVIIRE